MAQRVLFSGARLGLVQVVLWALWAAGPAQAFEGREGWLRGANGAEARREMVGEEGEIARRRGFVGDNAAGQAVGGRAEALRGPDGGAAGRVGGFSEGPDGSLNHESAAGLRGADGTMQRQSSFDRSGTGPATGQRTTTATGVDGNSYQGNTSYTQGQGISHSGTCRNAAGAVIACP